MTQRLSPVNVQDEVAVVLQACYWSELLENAFSFHRELSVG